MRPVWEDRVFDSSSERQIKDWSKWGREGGCKTTAMKNCEGYPPLAVWGCWLITVFSSTSRQRHKLFPPNSTHSLAPSSLCSASPRSCLPSSQNSSAAKLMLAPESPSLFLYLDSCSPKCQPVYGALMCVWEREEGEGRLGRKSVGLVCCRLPTCRTECDSLIILRARAPVLSRLPHLLS